MSAGDSKDGTCPFKRDDRHDCLGGWVGGGLHATAVCNWVGAGAEDERKKHCRRWYYEATLADIKPAQFCCPTMQSLFHECAEESGYMAGGFAIMKGVNDGKMVWRNFARTRFVYCPFCGKKLKEDEAKGEPT